MQINDLFPEQNRHVRLMLGLYIARRRREAGLSPEQVAEQISMPLALYKRIEYGAQKLTGPQFESICSLLELETEDLLVIGQISSINYINELSKALAPNYPA